MTLRIKSLKFLPAPLPGYKRTFEQCRTCDRVYFRDYVPYSLSNPILTLPCGHGLTERHETRVRTLPADQAQRIMLGQYVASREQAWIDGGARNLGGLPPRQRYLALRHHLRLGRRAFASRQAEGDRHAQAARIHLGLATMLGTTFHARGSDLFR